MRRGFQYHGQNILILKIPAQFLHSSLLSALRILGIGLGFTLALTLLGMVRELIGAGSLFGATILPETCNLLLFVLPPGAFISLGFLTAIMGRLSNK